MISPPQAARRDAVAALLACGLAGLTPPARPALAALPELWRLELPASFEVRRRLGAFAATPDGLTIALLASERATGAEARLTCVPLGGRTFGGFDAQVQRVLTDALVTRPPAADAAAALGAYARALDASVADAASPLLSHSAPALLLDETRGAAPTADGRLGATRRYLRFAYESSACPIGAWQDGACEWRGSDLLRAHTCVLAAGTLGFALTETERAREAEGLASFGRASAIWLLNLSAPAKALRAADAAGAVAGGAPAAAAGLRARIDATVASFDLLD